MAPQIYLTMYREQFVSPGRTKREQLRPTSANRRNNPQPRPDFLFPRNLQPNYKSRRTPTYPSAHVGSGRPVFPPISHLSFHSPVIAGWENSSDTVETDHKPDHMPLAIKPSSVPALPSADGAQKRQQAGPHADPGFELNTALRDTRLPANVQTRNRPKTSYPLVPQHHYLQAQYRRSSSSSVLDYRGCYSCFHVVRPYQAGHYIIHPEFVSESLR